MCKIDIDPNPPRGGMYWGPGPVPSGMEIVGVVRIADGPRLESGALLQRVDGRFFIGNAGVTKGLPQRETTEEYARQVDHG
jgi:hypothetical protein